MATPGWARKTSTARVNRVGLSKTSGWSPLAVDAFFPAAAGSTTNVDLTFNATGTTSVSNLLVKIVDLTHNAVGTISLTTLKVFTDVFSYTGTGTNTLNRVIGKLIGMSASGTSTKQRQVSLPRVFSAIGTSLYADTVSFGRTLLHTGLGVLVMTKTFIGGGGGTVSTLVRRGKLIMNKFGRW